MANQRGFSSSSPGSPAITLTSSPPPSSSLCASFLCAPRCIFNILSEFPDVLSSNGITAPLSSHQVCNHLLTNPGPPVFDKLAVTKAGIIRHSTLPWSSPLQMVKKDGGWHPCVDYRNLNAATVPDLYPILNIADFTSRISCSTIFSKLYLQKGYYQFPVALEDVQKTAIITLFGMFESLRMPFGLINAGNTFH